MVKYHRSENFIHFTYLEAISLVKTKKNRGVVFFPPGKNQNRKPVSFWSFGVDPLNWQSFIEIGEMVCSTIARYSRGHALNKLPRIFSYMFLVRNHMIFLVQFGINKHLQIFSKTKNWNLKKFTRGYLLWLPILMVRNIFCLKTKESVTEEFRAFSLCLFRAFLFIFQYFNRFQYVWAYLL